MQSVLNVQCNSILSIKTTFSPVTRVTVIDLPVTEQSLLKINESH
jgi:hypothetical protein